MTDLDALRNEINTTLTKARQTEDLFERNILFDKAIELQTRLIDNLHTPTHTKPEKLPIPKRR